MNDKLIDNTMKIIEKDLEVELDIVLYNEIESLLKKIWQDGYHQALGRFNNPDIG